jgi:hypothetical protein
MMPCSHELRCFLEYFSSQVYEFPGCTILHHSAELPSLSRPRGSKADTQIGAQM